MQAETGAPGSPDPKEKVRRDQKAVEGGPLCCQGTALPACLFSSCVPQLPGQPLEQGAVGAAEVWHCRQWVGIQTSFWVRFPRKLIAYKES